MGGCAVSQTVQTTFARRIRAGWQFHLQNRRVRERDYCIECGRAIRDDEYDWKFVAAGGCLEGPFCGQTCVWRWLSE